MAYDWEEAAKGEAQSDRLSPGVYQVKCSKVVMGKNGVPFESKNGDAQVMIVVENESGQEGSVFFTLSAKASWALARWLSKSGVDLKKMKEVGVHPDHFADEKVAAKFLLGKKTTVEVKVGKDPKYPEIVPLDPGATAGEADALADLNLDDIPF